MSQHIGLDFGAKTTVISVRGKGIVLREPTVAAVDTLGNVIAVGTKALLIHGRSPGTVTLRRPIDGTNITDFNLTAEILDRFIELAAKGGKKHVTAAVKYSVAGHNREILKKALEDCRTGRITLTDSATAALLGSGFTAEDKGDGSFGGSVICDIGASVAEASYIRNGELLRTQTVPSAGDAADRAIIAYLRRKYGLAVSAGAANEAKHKIVLDSSQPAVHTFSGTDGSTGMPKKLTVGTDELVRPCAPQIGHIADLLRDLLANLPHHGENVSTADRIILVGGGAAVPGIAGYLSDELGREVIAASTPTDCIALGICEMLRKNGR